MAAITKDMLQGVKSNLLTEIVHAQATIDDAKATIERARACLGLLDAQLTELDTPEAKEGQADEDVSRTE